VASRMPSAPFLRPAKRSRSSRIAQRLDADHLDFGRPGLSGGVEWQTDRELGRVHRRQRRLAGQHPRHLVRGKVADRADRLFGVVRGVWCDDHVVQTEERVHRLPVPLLDRFLLDVVQAGSGDPALLEGQVQGVVMCSRERDGLMTALRLPF